MNELQAIVTDHRTGALPKNEIVPFLGYMLRKAAWFFILVAVLGTVIVSAIALRGG